MKILPLLLALLLFPVLLKAQDSVGTNTQERKVLKLINSLPEVQRENNFRKKHKAKQFLHAYIQDTPTAGKNYYRVTIGEVKGERLFTYEWYYVDAKTYVISYWDVVNDKVISLNEKRKLDAEKY